MYFQVSIPHAAHDAGLVNDKTANKAAASPANVLLLVDTSSSVQAVHG